MQTETIKPAISALVSALVERNIFLFEMAVTIFKRCIVRIHRKFSINLRLLKRQTFISEELYRNRWLLRDLISKASYAFATQHAVEIALHHQHCHPIQQARLSLVIGPHKHESGQMRLTEKPGIKEGHDDRSD